MRESKVKQMRDEANRIMGAFNRYTKTNDESYIKDITYAQIKHAIYQCASDSSLKKNPWYEAMLDHKAAMEATMQSKRQQKEKWTDRGITALITIIVMVVGQMILNWILN